jgi:hypothetical protein
VGSSITTPKVVEVGHWNIEEVEMSGIHPVDGPPISCGYIEAISLVLIYFIYKW